MSSNQQPELKLNAVSTYALRELFIAAMGMGLLEVQDGVLASFDGNKAYELLLELKSNSRGDCSALSVNLVNAEHFYCLNEEQMEKQASTLLNVVLSPKCHSGKTEAGKARVILGNKLLSEMLNVPVSMIEEIVSSNGDVEPAVLQRLHFVCLILGNLSGSYTFDGQRSWFERERTISLGGGIEQTMKARPVNILNGQWSPAEPLPQAVYKLSAKLKG